jgi:hypothetical protein
MNPQKRITGSARSHHTQVDTLEDKKRLSEDSLGNSGFHREDRASDAGLSKWLPNWLVDDESLAHGIDGKLDTIAKMQFFHDHA